MSALRIPGEFLLSTTLAELTVSARPLKVVGAPPLLAACLPHVVATRGNIAVDFLGRRIGPRAQYWLDVFGAFAVFVFFALMAWQYLRYTIDMKSTGEVMAILRWPVWPWWAAVTLFVFITALVALATLTHREEASA